ncbi:MAG: nucleotidyltransferase family protein [Candidatus Obscuribacterales bacterium]|nr:nucleotidyltransferase family protein [Candidatus Obscuribacterales bacterium]
MGKNYIAALLRDDRALCGEILSSVSSKEAILDEILSSGIPLLLLKRLYALGLNQLFFEDSALSMTKMMAALTTEYQRMDRYFNSLLFELGDLRENILWLKGTSLSRNLYEEPTDRLSNDFDLLLRPGSEEAIFIRFQALGFVPVWSDPGHCHQYLVGPTGQFADLFKLPTAELRPHNLTMVKEGWPTLELKFSPLDNGLRLKEIDRLFADAERVEWRGLVFLAPSKLDHLLMELTHFHKHSLVGWSWLYDMHLLAESLSAEQGSWPEFLRRCQVEEASLSALLGLQEMVAQLKTNLPQSVLSDLERCTAGYPLCFAKCGTAFLWNCCSLPELILNTFLLGDTNRKLKILASCLFPDDNFIRSYYFNDQQVSPLKMVLARFVNFFVLLLPAGIIRRSFGSFLWQEKTS